MLSLPARTINRLSPLALRSGRMLRNRIVIPPMASSTATVDGLASAATLAHYAKLSKVKVGLIFVEYTYVHISGRSEEQQLGAATDAHLPGLTEIAATIHTSGALAGLQLTHAGGKTEQHLTDGRLLAPSAIAVPVKDRQLATPQAMTEEDILLWKSAFTAAAVRAAIAGFDLIELHAAHGYGLNQWLSPLTNDRSDAYGGSPQARLRLLAEIITSIREQCPQLLLAVRMPGQDFMPGGLTPTETCWIAKRLEALGVSLLDISSGIGGWRRPGGRAGEGYLVEEAAAIQAAVEVPVIGVGGIESADFVDKALAQGKFSLAAVGRAILRGDAAGLDLEARDCV